MKILTSNLYQALKLAIDAQAIHDDKHLGAGNKSCFRQGLMEVCAAIERGEDIEVSD